MEYIDMYYVDITNHVTHVHTPVCYGDYGLICDHAWFDETDGGEAGGA